MSTGCHENWMLPSCECHESTEVEAIPIQKAPEARLQDREMTSWEFGYRIKKPIYQNVQTCFGDAYPTTMDYEPRNWWFFPARLLVEGEIQCFSHNHGRVWQSSRTIFLTSKCMKCSVDQRSLICLGHISKINLNSSISKVFCKEYRRYVYIPHGYIMLNMMFKFHPFNQLHISSKVQRL